MRHIILSVDEKLHGQAEIAMPNGSIMISSEQEPYLHPSVNKLNLERISWKIMNDDNRIEDITENTVQIAENEYRRFLTLKIENPRTRLSPSALMDLYWHAHILDTVSYAEDCEILFGEFLHHAPNFGPYQKENESFDGKSWREMCRLYNERFGEEPVSKHKSGGNCDDVGGKCACNCGDTGI
ncbi:hypothetical protein OAV27_01140 [Euryarchaeota archaeon]|nr:hypothetical protein [Euryarchaeota archaeon]